MYIFLKICIFKIKGMAMVPSINKRSTTIKNNNKGNLLIFTQITNNIYYLCISKIIVLPIN